jgi:hypothetical protein
MAAILIENVSLLSHKLQIAAAPNEQGRRGRDRMVVGFDWQLFYFLLQIQFFG